MKVKFVQNCEFERCVGSDLDNGPIVTMVMKPGDIIEFEIVGHAVIDTMEGLEEDLSLVNVDFYDESVAFGLSIDWFEEI